MLRHRAARRILRKALAHSPLRSAGGAREPRISQQSARHCCSVRVKVARYYIKFHTHLAHELRSPRRAEGLVRGRPSLLARPQNNERERAVSDLTFAQAACLCHHRAVGSSNTSTVPVLPCRLRDGRHGLAARRVLLRLLPHATGRRQPTVRACARSRPGPGPPLFAGGHSSLRRAWQAASSQQHPHGIFVLIGIVSWREPDSG